MAGSKTDSEEFSLNIGDTTKGHLNNPLHDKIQFKFDAVFPRKSSKSSSSSDSDFSGRDEQKTSPTMSPQTQPPPNIAFNDFSMSGIDINFSSSQQSESDDMAIESTPKASQTASANASSNEELGFTLDFDDTSSDVKPTKAGAEEDTSVFDTQSTGLDLSSESGELEGFEVESHSEKAPSPAKKVDDIDFGSDDISFGAEEETTPPKKTDKQEETAPGDDVGFSFGEESDNELSFGAGDLMSTQQDKENIGTAIQGIVSTPKDKPEDLFGEDDIFAQPEEKNSSQPSDDFDLSGVEFADKDEDIVGATNAKQDLKPAMPQGDVDFGESESPPPAPLTSRNNQYQPEKNSFITEEDSNRVHATIRQLREEREELLLQIKNLKAHAKETEQDNLTLKAAFDEAKIEISIIKKRHLVEIEDLRYRMAISEEKRILAEEKAKLAENNRVKLEQRVRIDYNQVKQREKELESKLEMLSLDLDAQVHTRDQKILELRRKIDSLEFNMENVSIKEQKSLDDKRKIEDKLNKIMKTLRHSIKNLEDDIEMVTDSENEEEVTEKK